MPCLVHMSCPFNISSHWPDSQSLITCSQVGSVTRGNAQGEVGESSQRWFRPLVALLKCYRQFSPNRWPFHLISILCFLADTSRKGYIGHKTKRWIQAGFFLNLLFSFLSHPAFSRFSVSLVSLSVCIFLFLFRKGGAITDHRNCIGFRPQKFEMLQ